jgi:GT2 family glycosyltransferase
MNLIVTITYNAMKDGILPPFFACLTAQRDRNFEILVIDNASSDRTVDYLRGLDLPNLHIVINDTNIGFGRACNQGIAFARERRASHVTFLNNDTEFDDRLLGSMVAALEESGAAGLSPLITYHGEPERVWFQTGSYRWSRGMIPYHDAIDRLRADVVKERRPSTAFAPGCCLIFHIDTFDVVPGFDERYFVYWEDADLCMTLRKKGLQVVTDTAMTCLHKVSISTGGAFSDFSIFHFTRGHMLFVRKHFGTLAIAYVLPVAAAKTALNLVRRRMRWRQLPNWMRGTLDGLRA